MKSFVITVGMPVTNMGSQAMVRALAGNIKEMFPDSFISVYSREKGFGRNLHIPNVDRCCQRYTISYSKRSPLRLIIGGIGRFNRRISNKIRLYNLIKDAKRVDAVIIIGGDNYDASYKSLIFMQELSMFVDEIGREKIVMYNCSLSETDLTDDVIRDLGNYKYLTVRDSISYDNVRSRMPDNKVSFYPDVAFSLQAEKVNLPQGWEDGNMIGVNLSTLITNGKYGISEDQVLKAYYRMLDYIIHETTLKICFIPHVKNNADLLILRKLYDYITDKHRALIIDHENFDAAQIKYIISKCRLFVGARTHATIAAYSSEVPTLVIGYSVKSVGIARDIFCSEKDLVIPVGELKEEFKLQDIFRIFLTREEEIRGILNRKMPGYIESSKGIKKLLAGICDS